MADLVRGPIDVASLLAAAARPECGATALFLGTTRDHHEGRRVVRLAYEAYEAMARTVLEAIERRACAAHDVASCTIVHRLGDVPVREASVAVVVTAPHRAPAFDACRWAMEQVKHTAPIWKKEFFAEGDPEWVKGSPLG